MDEYSLLGKPIEGLEVICRCDGNCLLQPPGNLLHGQRGVCSLRTDHNLRQLVEGLISS